MEESKEELKSFLMTLKKKSEKVGLKLSIQKTKIMASSPITSWPVDGKTMETMTGFIFLGSKVTADGDCGHEIKRSLLLGRKAMTNLLLLLLSHFSHVRLCVTPETAAHQASPGVLQARTLEWVAIDQPRQHIQKQRHYFANKGPSSQGYGFSSGHVWM